MAQSDHNFVVKNGLEVAGNTTLGGTLSYNNIALPASDGTAGQVIITDGSGALSFGSVTTNAFSAIAVNGQTTITTDQVGDTLSFIGGTGIALTTDAPSDALTISVDADTDEVTEGSTNLYHTAARAVTAIEGSTNLSVNGGLIYADTATAYVGIGDTSPQGKLDVAGNILVNGTEIVSSSGNIANSALTVGGSIEGPLSNVTMQYGSSYTGTPIQGSFWFDSLNQKTKVYTGSAWVDAVPASSGGGGGGGSATDANATFSKYTYNITSTTSAVSGADANSNTLSYVIDDSQNVEVFVNGIKQVEGSANDYVATTGSAVTFTYNLSSGSVVDIQVYELLTADSFYLKTETYTQPQVNTQITTALGDYVPAAGGTFTGLTTVNMGAETSPLRVGSTGNDAAVSYSNASTPTTYNVRAGMSDTDDFSIWTSDTKRLTVKDNGNVGIGVSNPQRSLVLYDSASSQTQIQFQNSTTGTATGDGFGVGLDSAEKGFIWNYEGNDTYIGGAGGTAITIKNDGKVGIGTDNPDRLLHLQKTRGTISSGTSDAGAVVKLHTTAQFEAGYNSNATDFLGGLEFSSDDTSGSGLGGAGVRAAIRAPVQDAYNNVGLSFETGGTKAERMRILHNGNVGIGTPAPATPLHVRHVGNPNSGGNRSTVETVLTLDGTGHYPYAGYGVGIDFKGEDYGNTAIREYAKIEAVMLSSSAQNAAGDPSFTSGLTFWTNSGGASGTLATEKMRIDSAGSVTMPSHPNFLARIPSGSVAITSNGWATFNFNSTALGWDKGGNFTGGTKRFTAPVAGVYFFQWLIQVENITDAPTWYYAYPTVNGSGSFGTTNGMTAADQVEPVGVYHAIKGTQSLQLAASDYVEMRYYWDNGNGNLKGGGESMWAGHLIG